MSVYGRGASRRPQEDGDRMGGLGVGVLGMLDVMLGLLVALGLVIAVVRGGRQRRKPLVATLVVVLALTAVGGVTWVRATHGGSTAPVDARLTLFIQGFDCSNGGATCNLPNALYAVRADTGAVRWEARARANTYFVSSTPLVADGVVYAYSYASPVDTIGTMDNLTLTAWRGRDGVQLWHTRVLAECCETPTTYVAGDKLAILDTWDPGSDGLPSWRLLRLQARDGARLGAMPMPFDVYPTVVDDVMYLCLPNKAISAVRVSDGALLWRSPAPGAAPGCTVTVADGMALASSVAVSDTNSKGQTGQLLAMNASTGQTLWRYAAPTPYPLAVGDGLVVLGEGNQLAPTSLVALRASDGTIAWRRQGFPPPTGGYRGSAPPRTVAVGGGLVLFGGGCSTLWALHADTGGDAWRISEDGHSFVPLGVVNGAVLLHSTLLGCGVVIPSPFGDGGEFYSALRASDGAQYWQTPIKSLKGIVMGAV